MRSSNKEWDPNIPRQVVMYTVLGIADQLTEDRPFFQMRAGGVYAIKEINYEPAMFLRVDKPRMPRKFRKALKRKAKALAIANS